MTVSSLFHFVAPIYFLNLELPTPLAEMAPYNLPVDSLPGTVHLVDLEHTMHTRHAGSGDKDIVLVPTPSNDPDDPLNWSPKRKLMNTASVNM